MRDKQMLEYPEKMCEYCCNFDKEHIGMDGTAFCKLTMTLAYSEDYGGNCMFYNVPKEQIIVPPCKVGQTVYFLPYDEIIEAKVVNIEINYFTNPQLWISVEYLTKLLGVNKYKTRVDLMLGKTVFLTKEEAEKALAERSAE